MIMSSERYQLAGIGLMLHIALGGTLAAPTPRV